MKITSRLKLTGTDTGLSLIVPLLFRSFGADDGDSHHISMRPARAFPDDVAMAARSTSLRPPTPTPHRPKRMICTAAPPTSTRRQGASSAASRHSSGWPGRRWVARSGSRGHAAAPAPHECRRTRRPTSTPTAGGGCSQTHGQRPGPNRRPRGRRTRSRKGPKEPIRTDTRLASHYRVRLACESPEYGSDVEQAGAVPVVATAPRQFGCQFSPACSLGRRDDVFRRRSLPGMKPAVRAPIETAEWATKQRRPHGRGRRSHWRLRES